MMPRIRESDEDDSSILIEEDGQPIEEENVVDVEGSNNSEEDIGNEDIENEDPEVEFEQGMTNKQSTCLWHLGLFIHSSCYLIKIFKSIQATDTYTSKTTIGVVVTPDRKLENVQQAPQLAGKRMEHFEGIYSRNTTIFRYPIVKLQKRRGRTFDKKCVQIRRRSQL
jgi:hypothetical protein